MPRERYWEGCRKRTMWAIRGKKRYHILTVTREELR